MPKIRIENFNGMIPILDAQLLPMTNAARAENTYLYSGDLVGLKAPRELLSLTNPDAKKVFRIPLDIGMKPDEMFSNSLWMEFEDPDTDVVRSPVANDQFARFYWASPTEGPRYNTTARIQSGQPSFRLGIPQPLTPPTVSPTDTASEVESIRAYVYTFVSEYGEEGPPSAAVIGNGKEDSVWTITVAGATLDQATDRNLSLIRIYRTITSAAGVATYFFVIEIPIAQNIYVDTLDDTLVSGQGLLNSTAFVAPPNDLKGIVAMPNGMLVGWQDNNLYFCQPYLPHAWPAQYGVSVDAPIVGLAVTNQTLCILTSSFPATASGVNPASVALAKLQTLEPCLSRASIVAAPEGVYYAGPNGLVQMAPGQVGNITDVIIKRADWQSIVNPWTLRATRFGTAYMAVNAPRDEGGAGVLIDTNSSRAAFVYLLDDRPVQTFTQDMWTGEVFTVYSGSIWHIDPTDVAAFDPYLWRSKTFVFAKPINMSVLRADFTVPDGTETLNPVPNTDLDQDLAADQYGLIKVYADGVHKYTGELREAHKIMRLPAGFKAFEWYFEVTSRVTIQSIELATSVQALAAASG